MQGQTGFWRSMFVVVLGCTLGCGGEFPAGNQTIGAAPVANDAAAEAGGPIMSPWTASADGKLKLRIRLLNSRLKGDANIPLGVDLQNLSAEPISVLKPLEDDIHDQTLGIELHGPDGRCKYVGPMPTYTLGAAAFVSLQPGETTSSILDLQPSNFESSDQPGDYRLTYRYWATDSHSRTAADRRVLPIWTGEITSEELEFTREDMLGAGS